MKPYLLLAILCIHCGHVFAENKPAPADATTKPYQYVVPEKTSDGWETASLGSVGLRAEPFKDVSERIANNTYKNIHSALVVKDGKLVFEEYFSGTNGLGEKQDYNRDTPHSLQSVTKSVNSLLIGIALDQHLIPGVEQKMSTFFPDHADLFADAQKNSMRLKDCLSMTAGLTWAEAGIPYTDPRNDCFGLNRSKDPVRYVFERPLFTAPGTQFLYHSGIAIMLGEVVHKATGVPADKFAEQHLFGPLGITEYRWGKLPGGIVHTGGGLWLRPRDMAKIGLLMLNRGRWQGKQIVSEAWVSESTKQQAPYRGYGYQWWLRSFRGRDRAMDAFAAQGRGGQFIIVVPDLQMVGVFTGWNDNALAEQPFEMMQRFVVPAVDVK